MTDTDDMMLVKKAQGGDRHAFAALVEKHYRLMFRAAWQWCGAREEAEDIAQEAAIKLAQNIGSFRHDAAFTTWLYRLVINAAKDHYKARNRRALRETPLFEDAVYVSERPSPEQALADKETLRILHELPESLKETVILVCWQGLSHKEAGVALDCSEGTISWRIHEARKKIAEKLELGREAKRHG